MQCINLGSTEFGVASCALASKRCAHNLIGVHIVSNHESLSMTLETSLLAPGLTLRGCSELKVHVFSFSRNVKSSHSKKPGLPATSSLGHQYHHARDTH